MTMVSSLSYLCVANANSVHLTCKWACENANSIDFIIKPIWSSSAQFLDPLEFNSFSLRLCQFGTFKLFVYLLKICTFISDGEWPGN